MLASHQVLASQQPSDICADAPTSGKGLPHGREAVGVKYLYIAQVNWQFDLFLTDGLIGDAFASVSDLLRRVQEKGGRLIVRAALADTSAVLLFLVVG